MLTEYLHRKSIDARRVGGGGGGGGEIFTRTEHGTLSLL